jgi:hypothetical protein
VDDIIIYILSAPDFFFFFTTMIDSYIYSALFSSSSDNVLPSAPPEEEENMPVEKIQALEGDTTFEQGVVPAFILAMRTLRYVVEESGGLNLIGVRTGINVRNVIAYFVRYYLYF